MSPRESDAQVEELLETLAELGALRAKRMFGGVGLYCDEVFFALLAEGVLYFKVDEESVGAYRAAGAAPFRPYPDRPAVELGYHEVPLEVEERPARLREWARRALEAARRRDAGRKKTKEKGQEKAQKKAQEAPATTRAPAAKPVAKLLNLGPKSAAWLRAVGIVSAADLERVGAVQAYRQVLAAGFAPTLNLLYALEGARLGLRHDRLSAAIKANLRARAAGVEG